MCYSLFEQCYRIPDIGSKYQIVKGHLMFSCIQLLEEGDVTYMVYFSYVLCKENMFCVFKAIIHNNIW